MKKKKLRIAVLIHAGLLPPDSKKGYSEEDIQEWKVEYDVISTLKKLGHDVQPVEMFGELEPLRKSLDEFKPHIAFNLLEEFQEYQLFDQQVVNYLELKKISYTGCNPRGLFLSKDKALSKIILTYHNISVPNFYTFRRNKSFGHNGYSFPLFVKPLNEEGSIGISQDSVVKNYQDLEERVQFLQSRYNTDVIAEDFIEGREIFVGAVGNERLLTLPPWELTLENDPGSTPIFTSRLKWDRKHQEKKGLSTGPAKMDERQILKFAKVTKEIFKALKLSGYCRMDYRLTEDGRIFLIEANPNPFLAMDEDFALSAKHSGIEYDELMTKIISAGLKYNPF